MMNYSLLVRNACICTHCLICWRSRSIRSVIRSRISISAASTTHQNMSSPFLLRKATELKFIQIVFYKLAVGNPQIFIYHKRSFFDFGGPKKTAGFPLSCAFPASVAYSYLIFSRLLNCVGCPSGGILPNFPRPDGR